MVVPLFQFLLVFAASFAIAAPSRTKVNPNPFVIDKVETTKAEFRGDEPLTLKLEWTLARGYHAYVEEFKGLPKTPADAEVRIQDIRKVIEFDDKFSKQRRQGVEGHGDIYVQIKPSAITTAGTYEGEFEIMYQACADDHCLLPKRVPVRFTAEITKVKPKFMGKEFDPRDWRVWLTVFLAGILTSFTPCVFPLIPITLAILGARGAGASHARGFALSLSYVFGIAFMYAILGLVAASTGALFGAFLGHPYVSLGLAVLFVVLALSTLELFPLETPAWLRTRLTRQKSKGGVLGAFGTGAAAGIIASPCVGPVLAAVLTYVAQSQDLTLGFALLFVFAMGLGMLFLALGTFSGFQKYLPRSGPWLRAVKYLFAASFLTLAFYYLQPWLKKWNLSRPQSAVGSEASAYPKLPWQPYSKELRDQAAHEGHPVVIDFWAEWCTACKELEAESFSQPEVQAFKNDFVYLKYDMTLSEAQNSPEGAKLKEEFGIVGLPHLVFLNKKGHFISELTLTGFESAADFAARVKKAKSK